MNRKTTTKTAFIEAIPLALAIAAYGISYGILAIQAGLDPASILMMSMLVFSGSVQLTTVAMLAEGAAMTSIIATVLLLNLRNVLYGAALAEGLAPAEKKRRWLLAFGVSDEPFVLGSARFQKYGPDPLYFGIVTGIFYLAWITSSFFGAFIGDQIDPLKWGLDLAFPITFAALLMPSLKGKPAIATAISAAVMMAGLESFLPGNELNLIISGLLAPFSGLYAAKEVEQ